MHQRVLIGRVAADANADDGNVDVVAQKARQQAAVRARAARAHHHPVDLHALLKKLLLQLLRAGHIAQPAQRVGATARHYVALAAFAGQRVSDLLHGLQHVGARRHDRDGLHAQQPEQKVVAAGLKLVAVGHALLDHEAALHALLDRGRQGGAAMVGLRRAAGDQGVSALRQRVGHQKLQLAGLVAAGRQAQHVIALDPDIGAATGGAGGAQGLGEMRQKFERGRAPGVTAARETT